MAADIDRRVPVTVHTEREEGSASNKSTAHVRPRVRSGTRRLTRARPSSSWIWPVCSDREVANSLIERYQRTCSGAPSNATNHFLYEPSAREPRERILTDAASRSACRSPGCGRSRRIRGPTRPTSTRRGTPPREASKGVLILGAGVRTRPVRRLLEVDGLCSGFYGRIESGLV